MRQTFQQRALAMRKRTHWKPYLALAVICLSICGGTFLLGYFTHFGAKAETSAPTAAISADVLWIDNRYDPQTSVPRFTAARVCITDDSMLCFSPKPIIEVQ
jgi:hypothetical protein